MTEARAHDLDNDELPETDIEKEERLRKIETSRNELRDRRDRARRNRRNKIPQPKVGDVLHVSVARGLNRRSRAGITFPKGPSVPVVVTALSDDEIDEMHKGGRTLDGKQVTNTDGAERILEDGYGEGAGLIVRSEAFGGEDLAAANQRAAKAERERDEAIAELQRYRDAQRAAGESPDGRPTRLPALEAAKAKSPPVPTTTSGPAQAGPDHDDVFGSHDADKK